MNIGVIGAGYVGLVTGTCLAEMGNNVVVCDLVQEKIDLLKKGQSPHYEPGLSELLSRNIEEQRISFSTDIKLAVENADAVFLAVGTPMSDDGSADLTYIKSAARDVAQNLASTCKLVIKSTVPVGTNAEVQKIVNEHSDYPCEVISNPEFLKEGAAIDDFMKPDRIVVGVRTSEAEEVMKNIYSPFVRTGHPIMVFDPESAEMVKYVANAMLANRISFMNEMSWICHEVGADIDMVRKGVGSDSRIGKAFLFPGLGYGGSCFPKDVRALEQVGKKLGLDTPICQAIDVVNNKQRFVLNSAIKKELGSLQGKTIGIWGLAFKPQTDDIREAPALDIIQYLLQEGASILAFDPVASKNAQKEIKNDRIIYCENQLDAVREVDALVVCTEWSEFRSPDFSRLKQLMKTPLIFDGRNLYDLQVMRSCGFKYYSVGRPVVL